MDVNSYVGNKVDLTMFFGIEFLSDKFIFNISCNPCNPSLGSLDKDIFPALIYCADLTSVIFFLLSFVAIYHVYSSKSMLYCCTIELALTLK